MGQEREILQKRCREAGISPNSTTIIKEHPISLICKKAGFTRKQICRVLGLKSRQKLYYWFIDPGHFFRIRHYEGLSNLLDVPLYELIEYIRTGKKDYKWWFEE